MKASTALALVVSAVAITSVNGGPFLAAVLRPRAVDEIWGGINITASVLEVYNAISHPTCNATDYCVQLATTVVPTCTRLQGTAGCWCTLHDPIHYCAICMSSPTDNTTTADQTQAATEGHANYHKGCAAWQAYLNASAAGSLSTSAPPSTSAPLATLTPVAQTSSNKSSGVSTGAIVGIAIAGVAFLTLVIAATFLIYRYLQNQAERDRRNAEAAAAAAANEKRQGTMSGYYGGSEAGDKHPGTPPLPMMGYQNQGQPMMAPLNNQGQPISPQSMYGSGVLPGQRDSVVTEAPTQGSYYPGMRQGSQHGGSNTGGQPLVGQPGQYYVQNDVGPGPHRTNGLGSPPPPFS
ncbi:hypothetical protein FRB90_002269 [Tulasnella sp. 427]|nr:hypothetical protein FRB90_002269 [Tulasnella sp. 427]